MKIDTIIRNTIDVGIIIVLICFVINHYYPEIETWKAFQVVETILGYIANLAIVAAVFKYATSETINIKGIAKVRLNRNYNNIQDLTNLISRRFFNGRNFDRAPVLDAFYKESQIQVIEEDPEYKKYSEDASNMLKINIHGEDFFVKRSSVRSLDALIDAVRWIHFNGEVIDNETRSAIYTEWYKIN